jgi:dihydroflavonol-4-reductase
LKAFVTGATGFLGAHVARVLAEQGAELRLLVRQTSDLRNLEGLKADRVTGDLRSPASLEKAMSGCEVVFHVAADYRLWVRDPDQMYRSNVEGTRACWKQRAKTVFVASCTPQASRPWVSVPMDESRTRTPRSR